MATYHRDLSGNDLHEPKGVDTASSGTVYVADGTGSGSWQQPFSRSLEAHFDNNNVQSIALTPAVTYITIDGADARTDISGVTSGLPLWDSTLNEIDLTNQSMQNGNVLYLNVGFTIDPPNQDITILLTLEFNHGTGTEYDFELERLIVPANTPKVYNSSKLVFLDSSINVAAPARLKIKSNVSGATIDGKTLTLQTV